MTFIACSCVCVKLSDKAVPSESLAAFRRHDEANQIVCF
ncbi:Hypothetical protein NGK_2397 [Neisseria gonorrhoeae NCCP11945]|uniref:Uncharacterized protein n=1 Tax=Neisseria gonorrhoeae (strain NCCP11945) TaxID=521006 RepID=B4RPX4_NEIG2|nr:Hypothetical protein NGK_2397 [Neisseria gonorrhoeae NCCP11945]